MSCTQTELKIADFVSGRLPPPEAAGVAEHVRGCPGCRDLADRIERLYALDVDDVPELPRPAMPRLPAPRRRVRAAAGVAAAIVTLAVVAFLAGRGGDEEPPPDVHLDVIAVELPSFPPAWIEGEWLTSREEALRLAAFTGKPLLEMYSFKPCPRCRAMTPLLASDDVLDHLADFVCYREEFLDRVPERIAAFEARLPHMYMMPAILVSDGETELGPVWEISSRRTVFGIADRWERLRGDSRAPLDRAGFERARAKLESIPARLARLAYAGVLADLAELRELGRHYRSRFFDVADEIERRIEAGLTRQVEQLEAEAPSRERAARARRLEEALGGHRLATRLATRLAALRGA